MASNSPCKTAMQNRIKFIYRPEGLTGVDKDSFRRLSIKHANGGINIKNNSANWITIPELTGNAKINKETLLLAPGQIRLSLQPQPSINIQLPLLMIMETI